MTHKTQKKAIVAGAGFCGLATTYQLLLHGWDVSLYDPKGIGKGTSGIAAGLLHPFAGESAKRSADADAGMHETLKLLAVADAELGKNVRTRGGIIRRAMTAIQTEDFAKCAQEYPEHVQWDGTDLWINEGCAVHASLYLNGLWLACQRLGATFHQQKVDASAVADLVVWATGADMADREPVDVGVLVTRVRGQLLEVQWPEDQPPLAMPISSKMYVVMDTENKSCIVGSTYERTRTDEIPDADFACRKILPKIYELLPFLKEMPILGCRAGVRASAPGHRPLLKRLNDKTFAIGGMGSKGLLYHALYATKLIDNIADV